MLSYVNNKPYDAESNVTINKALNQMILKPQIEYCFDTLYTGYIVSLNRNQFHKTDCPHLYSLKIVYKTETLIFYENLMDIKSKIW